MFLEGESVSTLAGAMSTSKMSIPDLQKLQCSRHHQTKPSKVSHLHSLQAHHNNEGPITMTAQILSTYGHLL